MKNGVVSLLLAIELAASGAGAADYLGADAVLKKLTETEAARPGTDDKTDAASVLRRDLKAFGEKVATLSPKEAASGWLTLLDRSTAEPQTGRRRGGSFGEVQFNEVLAVLPPPAAWNALSAAIDARPEGKGKLALRETALKMFGHRLTGNDAAVEKDVAAIKTATGTMEKWEARNFLRLLSGRRGEGKAGADGVEKEFSEQLDKYTEEEGSEALEVPDLVTLLGAKKAEALLRRALVLPGVQIQILVGDETKKLARKLAIELIAEIKSPPWNLVDSLDSVPLYEALAKRFPPTRRGGGRDHLEGADIYYAMGLIAANRSADALEFLNQLGKREKDRDLELPPQALEALDRGGYTKAVSTFLHDLLVKNPDLPFWESYVSIAPRSGDTDTMLALVRQAAAQPGRSEKDSAKLRLVLRQALLAADKIDESVVLLRQEMTVNPEESTLEPWQRGRDNSEPSSELVHLGVLMDRKEWVEEGMRRAAELAKKDQLGEAAQTYAGLLQELGRGPEAEAALLESLSRVVQQKPDPNRPWMPDNQRVVPLRQLVDVYSDAGRHPDVIALMDKVPWWGAGDLTGLNSSMGYAGRHHRGSQIPLDLKVAQALAKGGRTAEAQKILDAVLDTNGGLDPAYQLLLEIGGDKVVPKLDALFRRDQFEERPLIWKAEWLRRAKQFEEAEKVVRQAIAIDPSDGEQGPGDRMRAYAVLADIREARGDAAQAKMFRGAVTAIRLSERADRFHEAGLLTRAIKMYEESLTHFADAYCIQSRLAIQLADRGLYDAAEVHYLRAYELMPESFGRMESHCFGCERAFSGERAQRLAEKVFTQFVKKTPEKPQVFYLLAYLRSEQGRFSEALELYRQAVKLDPDYINAWSHLAELGRHIELPAADRDTAALNLLRLDPLGRHLQPDLAEFKDLKALWNAVEAVAKLQPQKPAALYPLAASRDELEKQSAKMSPEMRAAFDERQSRMRWSSYGIVTTPVEAIARNRIIALTATAFGSTGMMSGLDF